MPLYFIAIIIPDDIGTKITAWKYYMKEHYGCTAALKSPPHITLIPPFLMQETNEPAFLECLNTFSMQQPGFEIRLQDLQPLNHG